MVDIASFKRAVRNSKLVEVTFLNRSAGLTETRTVGAQDLQRTDSGWTLWFLDVADDKPHPFPKSADEVRSLMVLEEAFVRVRQPAHLTD